MNRNTNKNDGEESSIVAFVLASQKIKIKRGELGRVTMSLTFYL